MLNQAKVGVVNWKFIVVFVVVVVVVVELCERFDYPSMLINVSRDVLVTCFCPRHTTALNSLAPTSSTRPLWRSKTARYTSITFLSSYFV